MRTISTARCVLLVNMKGGTNMKMINIWMALAGIVMLTSCAITDIDKSADFDKYKTFGFGRPVVEVDDPAFKSELIDDRITSTLRDEFQKRGLVYSPKNPDLVVTYHTYTEKKVVHDYAYMPSYRYMGYGRFYRFWGYPYYPYWGYPDRAYNYTEGTLIVDVNDVGSGDHIWRGLVRGKVTESALQKQVDKAVKAIAKKYPVKPKDDSMKLPANDDVI
jgi:hypothetical protein